MGIVCGIFMIIVDLVVLFFVLGIIVQLAKWVWGATTSLVKWVGIVALAIFFLPPIALAFLAERIFYKIHLRTSWVAMLGIANIIMTPCILSLGENEFVAWLNLLIGVALVVLAFKQRSYIKQIEQVFLTTKHVHFEHTLLFYMNFVAMLNFCSLPCLADSDYEWIAVVYVIASACLVFYIYQVVQFYRQLTGWAYEACLENRILSIQKIIASCPLDKTNAISEWSIEDAVRMMVVRLCLDGKTIEVRTDKQDYLYPKQMYDDALCRVHAFIKSAPRLTQMMTNEVVHRAFEFSEEGEADYFIDHHTLHEWRYYFEDGVYFIHEDYQDDYVSCSVCQSTHRKMKDQEYKSDWTCSFVCVHTLAECLTLKNKAIEEREQNKKSTKAINFSLDGKNSSNISKQFARNRKWLKNKNGGHGFTAEQGNTIIDEMLFCDAEILGDDNKRRGPDRLVDGAIIQTKYCKTATQSVNAAFDKNEKTFAYYDRNQKPMQIEVPSDQYHQAIKIMRKKIHDGLVPGVTDENQAVNLIRKGHLTYQQAVNITKFGTMESLTYDAATGIVSTLQSASVSFSFIAMMTYLQTQNHEVALRNAVIQSSSQAGKGLFIFVASQQVSRIVEVQAFLSTHIDVNSMPPSLVDFLKDSLNLKTSEQIQSALHGTVVTSVLLVVITAIPDVFRAVRGRISPAQLLKNVTIITAGVIGGVLGGLAGGGIGTAVAGPAGTAVGQVIGSSVGAAGSSFIAKNVMGKIIEDDAIALIKIMQQQIEIVIRLMALTDHEVKQLADRVTALITNDFLLDMQAHKKKMAFANKLVMPEAVKIIQKRPVFT